MTEEWKTHNGGRECPILKTAVVEVERRDGSRGVGPAGWWHSERDAQNSWKHNDGACDILKYRASEASPAEFHS